MSKVRVTRGEAVRCICDRAEAGYQIPDDLPHFLSDMYALLAIARGSTEVLEQVHGWVFDGDAEDDVAMQEIRALVKDWE